MNLVNEEFQTNFFFLRYEGILNLEKRVNLLGCLTLDLVCYSLDCKIQQGLDI